MLGRTKIIDKKIWKIYTTQDLYDKIKKNNFHFNLNIILL